jgi:hypothetical protein
MKTALYYPYLRIQNEGLLKQALLFWDQIEVITPFEHLEEPRTVEWREATDLIVRPYRPTKDEQLAAHEQLMALVDKPLPPWFYQNTGPATEWIIAEKFMYETWRELRKRGLARADGAKAEKYWSNETFGLLMMGVLADCCAGHTKVTVTDQPDAYDAVGKCLAAEVGAESRAAKSNERALVTAGVLSPSTDEIPLSNLVELRKRENGKNGDQYRQMRHKLFQQLADFSELMFTPGYTDGDRVELRRQFVQTFNDDFKELRRELRLAGRGWVFSSEMGVLTTAIGGALAIGLTGGIAGIPLALGASIPLVRMNDKYKSARFKALTGHFSSYLYLAKRGRFERDL